MANPKPLQLPGTNYSEGEETLFRRKLESQLLELEVRLEQAERRDGTVSSLASKRARYTGVSLGQEEHGVPATEGTVTEVTGGDGITVTDPTTTPEVSLDLKANGGAIISGSELAVDLSASGITGDLAVSDGGTGASTASAARTNLGCGTGDGTVTGVTGGDGVTSTGGAAPAISLDLKANGGAVIESAELAVDLGASSITGQLANSDLANDSVSYGGVSVALGASDATPAFNLTDATGLSLTAGVSGTLPIANGGTAGTTASTARTNLGVSESLDACYYTAHKDMDSGTSTAHTSIPHGSNQFPTGAVLIDWDEDEDDGGWAEDGSTGEFEYSGSFPTSGVRTVIVSWSMTLWYNANSAYIAPVGRVSKYDGSWNPVGGSVAMGALDFYLYTGLYWQFHNVSNSAVVDIESGDKLRFDYGFRSFSASGTYNATNFVPQVTFNIAPAD